MVECTRGGRRASERHYEQCVAAANCIASIGESANFHLFLMEYDVITAASYFREKYCLQRAPMFLCFYVFTAAIMHVTSRTFGPIFARPLLILPTCLQFLHAQRIHRHSWV